MPSQSGAAAAGKAGPVPQPQKAQPLWCPTFEPLMRYLLESNGVRIKGAVEVGEMAVNYCRGKDLMKWLIKHDNDIRAKFPNCVIPEGKALSATSSAAENAKWIGEQLIKRRFLYAARYKPLASSTVTPAESGSGTTSSTKGMASEIPRWPTRLEASGESDLSPTNFYVLLYEPASSWPKVILGLIVAAVLTLCMFPAWPLAVKLTTWYLSVILTTVLLSIIAIRLVVFGLVWFSGADFWIFPNLFDEELGFVDSFRPVFSFTYRNDPWIMCAGRVLIAGLLVGTIMQLGKTHSVGDVRRFAAQQFLDILDWGHQKLSALPDGSSGLGRAGSLEANNEEKRWIEVSKCLRSVEYKNATAFEEECLATCECVSDVVNIPCFEQFSESTKNELRDFKIRACRVPESHDGAEGVAIDPLEPRGDSNELVAEL